MTTGLLSSGVSRPSAAVRLALGVALAVFVAACSKSPSPAPSRSSSASATTLLTGKVLERVDAPPYTYLKLETETGEAWAAVPMTGAGTGAVVKVSGVRLTGVEVRALRKTLDVVIFGTMQEG